MVTETPEAGVAASSATTSPAAASEDAHRFVHPLSPTQLAILRRFAEGKRTKEIAIERGCAPRTIEAHIEEFKLRLCAETITQAVVICIAAGWIDISHIAVPTLPADRRRDGKPLKSAPTPGRLGGSHG